MTGFDGLALPYAPLLLRMVLVAVFVVTVALVAERLGPFLGAMVASLPLYTGPVYLLLALEHDAAYLAASAVASLAICGANPVFVVIYAMLARTRRALPSLAGALAAWGGCAMLVQHRDWTLIEGLLFVAPIFAVAILLARHFTRGVAVRRAGRRWLDLAQRAVFVALLTGVVIVAGRHVPPQVTGILSVMPILTTSLILVMHPRVGGPATAALLAHTLTGLVGMVAGFALIVLAMPPLGVWPALGLGLATTVGWNIMLIGVRHLSLRRLPEPSKRSPLPRPGPPPAAVRPLPPPVMPRRHP